MDGFGLPSSPSFSGRCGVDAGRDRSWKLSRAAYMSPEKRLRSMRCTGEAITSRGGGVLSKRLPPSPSYLKRLPTSNTCSMHVVIRRNSNNDDDIAFLGLRYPLSGSAMTVTCRGPRFPIPGAARAVAMTFRRGSRPRKHAEGRPGASPHLRPWHGFTSGLAI